MFAPGVILALASATIFCCALTSFGSNDGANIFLGTNPSNGLTGGEVGGFGLSSTGNGVSTGKVSTGLGVGVGAVKESLVGLLAFQLA